MSRAAFLEALIADPVLSGYGLTGNTVFQNYSSEERPSNSTPFVILRWGEERGPLWGSEKERGPRQLTLWVHFPIELSNDYNKVTAVLDQIDTVVRDLRDVPGTDGYTLSFVEIGSRSPDIVDDGFETIARNGNYQVYSVAS